MTFLFLCQFLKSLSASQKQNAPQRGPHKARVREIRETSDAITGREAQLVVTDLACRVDVETRMGISGLKSIVPYFARMNIHLPATSSCSPRVGFDYSQSRGNQPRNRSKTAGFRSGN